MRDIVASWNMKKSPPPTTDSEWSFEMIRTTALMILQIADISHKYGYEMIDCHAKNVMFLHNHPMYVDLGSFVPRVEGATGFRPYYEFLSCYYYVLKLRESGMEKIPFVLKNITYIPEIDYWIFTNPCLRYFSNIARKFLIIKHLLYQLTLIDRTGLSKKGKITSFFLYFIRWVFIKTKPFEGQRLSYVEKKIRKIKITKASDKSNSLLLTWPIEVLQLLKNSYCMFVNPNSLADLDQILSAPKEIWLCDYSDENGNKNYIDIVKNNYPIQSLVYDFNYPYVRCNTQKAPEERLRPDIIVLNNPDQIAQQTEKSFAVTLKSFYKYHFKYMIIIKEIGKLFQNIEDLYTIHNVIISGDFEYVILKKINSSERSNGYITQ